MKRYSFLISVFVFLTGCAPSPQQIALEKVGETSGAYAGCVSRVYLTLFPEKRADALETYAGARSLCNEREEAYRAALLQVYGDQADEEFVTVDSKLYRALRDATPV